MNPIITEETSEWSKRAIFEVDAPEETLRDVILGLQGWQYQPEIHVRGEGDKLPHTLIRYNTAERCHDGFMAFVHVVGNQLQVEGLMKHLNTEVLMILHKKLAERDLSYRFGGVDVYVPTHNHLSPKARFDFYPLFERK